VPVPRPPRPDDLFRLRIATEPCLSPDGRLAVVTLLTVAPGFDAYRSALWIVPADGSALVESPQQIVFTFSEPMPRSRVRNRPPRGPAKTESSDSAGHPKEKANGDGPTRLRSIHLMN
jgi:hypothetical protein